MSGSRLLPILIVLLFTAPPALPEQPDSEPAASSARSSWSGPVQLTNSTNSSWDPSIYVDSSGNIHLAWQDGTDKTSIRYKSFAPSGEVIVNDTVLVNYYDPEPPVYVSGRPYAPRLDYNNGSLVLFWNDTENHPSGQTDHDEGLGMLRFSPDLKSRRDCWLPVYAIDRLHYGNPLYAFDSKGNIHFAYAGNSEWYGEPDVWYVKTNSTGAKLFSKYLARNETEVGVAVDGWDNVHLVWRNETGNLTYCRLDQNGTETCRIDQIQGINYSIFQFTIVAKHNSPGANIYWNEWDIHMCSISSNGTARTIFLHQGQGQAQIFNYDPRYPFVARSDARGLNYIFGYGYFQRQGGHTFPYDIIMGMTDEEGTRQLYCHAVEGMDLVDKGYSGVGPPFSAHVILPGQSGSYAYVAYSNDRLTWEDPPGGMNIYLDILGPYTADLEIYWIEFSDQGPLEKENITIRVEVGYFSSYPPGAYPMDFDVELFVDGVLAGSSHGSVYKMVGVSFNWTALRGLHNFTARVVSGLAELNVSNNEMNASLYVYGRPEISVRFPDIEVLEPRVGAPVNLSANITNNGETAGNFTWGFRLNDTVLSTETGHLGPGENGIFSMNWTPAMPGEFVLTVFANDTDPYELELRDNSFSLPVLVYPAPMWIEIVTPANGSRVQGHVEVRGYIRGMWGTPFVKISFGDGRFWDLPEYPDEISGEFRIGWDTLGVPNGWYNISVRADNLMDNVTATVRVEVNNQAPIVTFSPSGDLAINESEWAVFEANLSWGHPIDATFSWTVNGIAIVGQSVSWAQGRFGVNTTKSAGEVLSKLGFSTNWTSNGTYTVQVIARYSHFGEREDSFIWHLTVRNVNTAPVIWCISPEENPTVRQKDRLFLRAEADDAEGDVLTYSWFVDGRRCETAPSSTVFDLSAPARAGALNITVSVSDGEFQVSHSWNVTVLPSKVPVDGYVDWWPLSVAMVICAAAAVGVWMAWRMRKRPRAV